MRETNYFMNIYTGRGGNGKRRGRGGGSWGITLWWWSCSTPTIASSIMVIIYSCWIMCCSNLRRAFMYIIIDIIPLTKSYDIKKQHSSCFLFLFCKNNTDTPSMIIPFLYFWRFAKDPQYRIWKSFFPWDCGKLDALLGLR